jgi:hypothetical protein
METTETRNPGFVADGRGGSESSLASAAPAGGHSSSKSDSVRGSHNTVTAPMKAGSQVLSWRLIRLGVPLSSTQFRLPACAAIIPAVRAAVASSTAPSLFRAMARTVSAGGSMSLASSNAASQPPRAT